MKDVIIMRLVRPKPLVTFYDVHLVLSSDWRKRFWQTVVVYGHSSNNICGGGARWSYQKSRDGKSPWPELMSVTWPKSNWPEACSVHARFFPRAFFLTRVVVQVPWLPEVTKGHVTPLRFPWVCATGSCAISALVGLFDRRWRYETSPRSDRRRGKGCVHAQPEVVQHPP